MVVRPDHPFSGRLPRCFFVYAEVNRADATRPSRLAIGTDTANTLLALFVVAVCSVSVIWALKNVQIAVTDARASLFSGLLASQAEALKTWAAEKQADTHRWAKHPSTVSLSEALLDRRKLKASRRFRSQDIQAEFLDRISPAVEDLRLAAANIVAPNGTLIASLVPEYVGTRVTGEYL